jgi:hypothetical protein
MANLDPEDLPFLLNEESGGPIDRELLRNKWTARTQLFFNNQNYGNRRGARANDGWSLPNLQLDPAVKYRAFDGQKWGDEILAGHSTSGWKTLDNAPKGVFFNPGLPLWSYAKPAGGSPQFVFATLGEGWGDRSANTPMGPHPSPLDWNEGGSALTPKMQESLRHFFPPYKFKSHGEILGLDRSRAATTQLLDTQRTLTHFINENNATSTTIDELLRLKNKGHGEDTLEQKRDLIDYLEREFKKAGRNEWIIEADLDFEVQDYEQMREEARAQLLEMKDRTGYDASLDKNDLRRKIDLYTDKIRDSKIHYYSRRFQDQARQDTEAIFGPKAIGALKEHLTWLQATVSELDNARAGKNPHLAFSLKTAEEALTKTRKSFSTVGLSFLNEIVEQEHEIKKLAKDIFGNSYAYDGPLADFPALIDDILLENKRGKLSIHQKDAFFEFLAKLTRSVQPTNDNLVAGVNGIQPVVQESPYLDYSITPAPSTYPLVGKDPYALIHDRDTPISNYFFDDKNRPYLLGPGNSPILLNASDDTFFLDQENILKNLTNFGAQGVVSDRRRLTLGGLDWAMMGKEGAMYSEQLPGARIDLGTRTIVDKETGGLPRKYVDFKVSDWEHVNITPAEYEKRHGVGWQNGLERKIYQMMSAANSGQENPHPDVGTPVALDEHHYGVYVGVRLKDGRLLVHGSPDIMTVGPGRLEAPHAQLEPRVRIRKLIEEMGGNDVVKKAHTYWYEASEIKTMPTIEAGESLHVHAAALNTEGTLRPSVLFKIDPSSPNGIQIIKEWNNDPTKWGFKPIPTGPLNSDALRESYVRFAQEIIDPVMGMTKEGVALDEFTRLMKDVKHPEGTPEHTKAVEQALKDANDFAEVELGINETRKLNKGLEGYTGAEQFASRALIEGFPQDLFKLMYRTGSSTYNWEAASKTPGYERIQNIIDESTRGNPNYGKLGSNFGPQLERYFDNKMFQAGRDFKTTSDNIRMAQSKYVNDAVFRGNVNRYIGERVPRVAMGALAGVQVKSHLDAGENIFQAVGNTAAEFAAGIAKFNLYERFIGSIETMGDATIDGHMRLKREREAIDAEWGEYLRRGDWSRWPIDEKGVMHAPPFDPKIMAKMGDDLEKRKKEEASKKATEKWNKENPLWVDGALNPGVL